VKYGEFLNKRSSFWMRYNLSAQAQQISITLLAIAEIHNGSAR
jgi:hypothetical protein